jgi:hypothetical protein
MRREIEEEEDCSLYLSSLGEQSAIFSSTDGLSLLKAATLSRCIDIMLDVFYTGKNEDRAKARETTNSSSHSFLLSDEDFASMFLLLHPYLITHGDLARILVGRYDQLYDLSARNGNSASPSAGDLKQWVQESGGGKKKRREIEKEGEKRKSNEECNKQLYSSFSFSGSETASSHWNDSLCVGGRIYT